MSKSWIELTLSLVCLLFPGAPLSAIAAKSVHPGASRMGSTQAALWDYKVTDLKYFYLKGVTAAALL